MSNQTNNDGGPAFPRGHLDGPTINPEGMSLRDYFAAKIMQGLCANSVVLVLNAMTGLCLAGSNDDDLSEHAYAMADAMLKARKQ